MITGDMKEKTNLGKFPVADGRILSVGTCGDPDINPGILIRLIDKNGDAVPICLVEDDKNRLDDQKLRAFVFDNPYDPYEPETTTEYFWPYTDLDHYELDTRKARIVRWLTPKERAKKIVDMILSGAYWDEEIGPIREYDACFDGEGREELDQYLIQAVRKNPELAKIVSEKPLVCMYGDMIEAVKEGLSKGAQSKKPC